MLFQAPLSVPETVLIGPGECPRQPLVMWANRDLISALGIPLPHKTKDDSLNWQRQTGSQPPLWVACASEGGVIQLLNFWGQVFLEKADASLGDGLDWKSVLRFADLGLCAAVENVTRYRLYTRYAASQAISSEPERASRTYERFVRKEFVSRTWEQFSTDFVRLCQTLWGLKKGVAESATEEAKPRQPARMTLSRPRTPSAKSSSVGNFLDSPQGLTIFRPVFDEEEPQEKRAAM